MDKKNILMATIKHIAGPFKNNMQECIMCGELICDYTHAMFEMGSPSPRGWPVGDVYVSGQNPQVFSSQRPDGETIVDCTK